MKYVFLFLFLFPLPIAAQITSFTGPDTVCVNAPITLQNTSTGAGNYFWNFCSGSTYNAPELQTLGNPSGMLSYPVFTAIAKEGDNYFVFVVSNGDRRLVKLSFGTNLLNTPTVEYVPGISITLSGEGIQLVQDAAGYHLIVVGGTVAQGSVIQKIDFGPSLSNPAPVLTNWGNVGNLAYPTDLYTFYEGNNLYGLTANFESGTITRFAFGTNLNTPPTGTNLGNFGGLLNRPAGLFAISEGGNWYVFVTNENGHNLTRLDFGNSLLNTPVAVNVGNPGGVLRNPRDISFLRDCGKTIALVVNGSEPGVFPVVNHISRLDFDGGITGPITGTDMGNPGGVLNFGSSISSVFRVGNELHAFIPNVTSHTLSRVSFRSCTDASVANSTQQTPPVFSYGRAGTYSVNLITDEGTPNQRSFCKTVVVQNPPVVNLGPDVSACTGAQFTLNAGAGFSRYAWNTGSDRQSIDVTASGVYAVTVANGGCAATDDVTFTFTPSFTASSVTSQIDCINATGTAVITPAGGVAPITFSLNGAAAVNSGSFANLPAGNHTVLMEDAAGCELTLPFAITVDQVNILRAAHTKTDPRCYNLAEGVINLQVTQGNGPFAYNLAGQAPQPSPTFTGLPAGTYKVYVTNANCIDSQQVVLINPPALVANVTSVDEACNNGDGTAAVNISGGTGPYSITWNGVNNNLTSINALSAGNYQVTVTDNNGCPKDSIFAISNIDYPRVRIINNDTVINIGAAITLRAENAPDYLWEPLDGSLSCQACATTIGRPVRPTTYIVHTVTGRNCIKADTVFVDIDYSRFFQMPNAFSPNGDGVNDTFRPKGYGMVAFSMIIYNRWGQVISVVTDPVKGWDGKFNNENQPLGTYVYYVQYAFLDDEGNVKKHDQKGTFTLLR